MNADRHPAPATLAEAEGRPPVDSVRRHLEACPRCQARLLAYRRFLAEPADLPAGDRAEARARLHAALRTEMGLDRRAGRASSAGRTSLASILQGLMFRPALAFAAVLLGVAGVVLGPRLWRPVPETLRQSGPPATVELLAPIAEGDSLALRWRASPGADAYRVTFYATDLQPIGPTTVTSETTLRIPAGSLHDRRGPGARVYVRLTALSEGDEIADSGPRSLRAH